MIEFYPLNRLDDEALSLFRDVRENFPTKLQKTSKKQLSWFIKSCKSHFYKVYFDSEFIGCVWFDGWNNEKKTVLFGAFGKRKQLIKNIQVAKAICNKYIEICGYEIYSETKIRTAQIALLKSGFKKIQEGIYKYYG